MSQAEEGARLQVALFSDSAAPVRNGVSVSVDVLVRRLRELGHSAHVFTSRYPGHSDQDPNYHRLRSVMTRFAGGYPMALPPFPPERELFFRQGFDVVHIHTPFIVGLTGLTWAKLARVPVVSTYHTQYERYLHYVPWAPDAWKRWAAVAHVRGMMNKADQVVVPSVVTRRWLHRMGVRTPTTVIPTGVPSPRRYTQFVERERLGARPGQTIVLTCGRLAPEKNQALLVSAFCRAAMADPNLVLWVVGDGPGRREITELVRRAEVGDKVRFFGSVSRDEVDRFYAAADIFAFTSVTETQGLVVLEAMSYGLPVVVCRGGAACSPIVHGQNGLKVATTPEAVAEAIVALAHDEALAARLCDGAKETASRATIVAMVDQTVEVYRRAIGERAKGNRVQRVGSR